MKIALLLVIIAFVFSQTYDPETQPGRFQAAMEKFKPVIYIHKDEKWFPSEIESVGRAFNGFFEAQLCKRFKDKTQT